MLRSDAAAVLPRPWDLTLCAVMTDRCDLTVGRGPAEHLARASVTPAGIGDDSAKLLERIDIRTIGDLLALPRTYADSRSSRR